LDFHNAQGAWQVRDLAQGNRVKLLWLQCIGGHGQILQDQFIGALFCTQLFLRGEEGSGDVDAAVLLAQMKAFCFVAVLILKYRGEQVLPAVLLHVVEAAVLIFLISFSRIYLAVHWPIDVLGGVAIGLLLLVAYSPLAQIDLLKIRLRTWIVGSIIAAAILYLLHPAGDGPLTVGFLLGALIGYRLELLYIQFKKRPRLCKT